MLSRRQPPRRPSPAAARDTASQLPLYATRQNVFAIPFTVDRRITHPVEVHLYVSTDHGATWQLSARQPPGARQFTFRSRGDGEYWFASRTLDASQQASSQGPLQAELRVVVDTVPPQIEFAVRTGEGGTVLANWQAADQNLLASSLKIEYQEEAAQPWKPVAIKPPSDEVVRTAYQGQTTWDPQTRSPTINVRAEVRDRAGNLAVVNRRLLLPLQPPQNQQANADAFARTSDPFARVGQPSEGAVAWPSDNVMPPLCSTAKHQLRRSVRHHKSQSSPTRPRRHTISLHRRALRPRSRLRHPQVSLPCPPHPTATPTLDPPPNAPAADRADDDAANDDRRRLPHRPLVRRRPSRPALA